MQTHTDPAALSALWQRARAMFARAMAAIGEPAAMAARTTFIREGKPQIAGWLARVESIVRKLLLAAAAGLVQDQRQKGRSQVLVQVACNAPVTSTGAPLNARAKVEIDATQPETWRARFSLSPPIDPRAVLESRAPRIRALWGPTTSPAPTRNRALASPTESALRFAFRLEALKRVLADPITYAERLARLMRCLVRRYPGAADRYAITTARPCVSDEGDPRLIIDAMSAAMFGAPVLADTS